MRGSALPKHARARAGRPAAARALLLVGLAIAGGVVACGETRSPIGDECLRGDDCLSGVCSSRTCVAAPGLVTGAGPPPPDEMPRIPAGEGGSASATDAQAEGG
jgi:hypothetical protein